MVKVESFEVFIFDSRNVYRPGETIEGVVQLKLNQDLQIKFLRVKLFGRSQSKLKLNHSGHGTTTHRDEEVFHSETIMLVGKGRFSVPI